MVPSTTTAMRVNTGAPIPPALRCGLLATDRHLPYHEPRRTERASEFQIAADHLDPHQHLLERGSDGDFGDRVGRLAALDPNSNGAAGIIAGDGVDAVADQFGDEQSGSHFSDQVFRALLSWFEIEVTMADPRITSEPAGGVAGGLEFEAARGVGVEQVAGEH